MTKILMTTWDGAGTTPPLMSVAKALIDRGRLGSVMPPRCPAQAAQPAGRGLPASAASAPRARACETPVCH